MNITVQVAVDPILREFICAWYGSDTIYAAKNYSISKKIKYHLALPPADFVYKQPECFINIELIANLFIKQGKKTSQIRTIYKNYLSEEGQRVISNDMSDWFKNIFRNFMAGYVLANNTHIGCQKKGIYLFSEFYNLTLDKINYEMLKKDWDRSKQKSIIWNEYKLNKKSA